MKIPELRVRTPVARGKSFIEGDCQLLVEPFFVDTFHWTKVKYGNLNNKLYVSLPEGGRKLISSHIIVLKKVNFLFKFDKCE